MNDRANAGNATPVDKYGKDHWSLLAYVESCCVDGAGGRGELQRSRMRCHPPTHRMVTGPYSGFDSWRQQHSTRLAGFFGFPDRGDPEKAIAAGFQLRDHDDWDCLDDLEAAGFIQILSVTSGRVRMTDKGCEVAAHLRAHKAGGGMFASFRLSGTGEVAPLPPLLTPPDSPEILDKDIDTCDHPELTAAYFGDAIFNRAGEGLIETVRSARTAIGATHIATEPCADCETQSGQEPGHRRQTARGA